MKTKTSLFKRCIFIEIFVIISSIISIFVFIPIYTAKEVIIPYAIHPFNICVEHPIWWKNIKIVFGISYIFANLIIANTIYSIIKGKINKKTKKKENIQQNNSGNQIAIYVGKNENEQLVYIPENGLYQNILITRNYRKW